MKMRNVFALVALSRCRVLLLVTLAFLVASKAESDQPNCTSAWSEPVNLGPPVNTSFGEHAPNFSRDGHWMFFVSSRPGREM